jgi:hypothetical protein
MNELKNIHNNEGTMKRLGLTFILLFFFILACTEKNDPLQPAFDERTKVEKFAYDYSQNHYFVDSIYSSTIPELNLFNHFYGNKIPIIFNEYRIKEIEVWKSAQGYIDPSMEINTNAFIDLHSKGSGHYPLDSQLRKPSLYGIPGQSIIAGRFTKLEEGIDYELNSYCGLLSFRINIGTDDQIAVAYRLEGDPGDDNDIFYGEFNNDLPTDSNYTVLLKLVKPKYLQPSFTRAWKNQPKNIYSLYTNDISMNDFELNIFYKAQPNEDIYLKKINNVPLIELFGLDKFDENGDRNPDGKFDFIPGKTILLESGDIIFSTLEPFGQDIPLHLFTSLQQNEIYEYGMPQASYFQNSRNFKIEVKYYRAD